MTDLPEGIWPKIPLIYDGLGSLKLANPAIVIKGKAKIQFDGLGAGVASIECDEVHFPDEVDRDLIQLLKKDSLTVMEFYKLTPLIDQISNNVIKEFIVKSSNGIFSITDNNQIYSYDGCNNIIKIRFLNSKFISEIAGEKPQAKYMLLPITNFIPSEFSNSDLNFRDHPLRTGYGDKLICFHINNNPCFIEPLINYDSLLKELLEGKCNRETTAVIVIDWGLIR